MQGNQFFAHSENNYGKKETVLEHVNAVAKLAGDFASIWGRREEAESAALLHDLGKYTAMFQQVLAREAVKVDHATPGALAILKKYRNSGIAAAIAVQGHHEGLASGAPKDLSASVKMTSEKSPSGRTYSSRDVERLLQLFFQDGGTLPSSISTSYPGKGAVADMLYVRMLFSALTDADFLATEAHFNATNEGMSYRPTGPALEPEPTLARLMEYKDNLSKSALASSSVQSMREDLFSACLEAGKRPTGTYTLTAPTGAGKTLSTLAFALQHAAQHNLRRIIVVLPFLNIIEQTARVYREALNREEDGFVLEDHSLAEHDAEGYGRLLAENWDSPLIITTTVRFFESLFSNRSTGCRRLHNVAKSVVIFDEAQTMPPNLAVPTLATLAELCSTFNCSVVFSTATQPAFDTLSPDVAAFCKVPWKPEEIVPAELRLIRRAERVTALWQPDPMSWTEVADQLIRHEQALAVVNTRKHAKELYNSVSGFRSKESVFHMSTDMCPAHRLDSLSKIKSLLIQGLPCHLISTQCIEAGVDIDFPIVWRALGPLESIVQAAGRCNRNGRQARGEVTVFLPQDEKYPGKDYELGAVQVKLLLRDKSLDLSDAEMIRKYYREFFVLTDTANRNALLSEAIKALDFPEVSRLYQWIPGKSANLLVPYKPNISDFTSLSSEARNSGMNRGWQRRARMLSVNVMLRRESKLWDYVETIRDRNGHETGWFILLNHDLYCPNVGLRLPDEHDGFFVV